MKLILYFGHTGTTKKAAEYLADKLDDVEVVDGTKFSIIDLQSYESLIVGVNVRQGKLNKSFMKFYKKMNKKGITLPISAFIVAADATRKGQYISKMEEVLPEDSFVKFVGGELNPDNAKGLSKKVILLCRKELQDRNLELPTLLYSQLDQLAEVL